MQRNGGILDLLGALLVGLLLLIVFSYGWLVFLAFISVAGFYSTRLDVMLPLIVIWGVGQSAIVLLVFLLLRKALPRYRLAAWIPLMLGAAYTITLGLAHVTGAIRIVGP